MDNPTLIPVEDVINNYNEVATSSNGLYGLKYDLDQNKSKHKSNPDQIPTCVLPYFSSIWDFIASY